MELPDNNNSFGIHLRGNTLFIGDTQVHFTKDRINIGEKEFNLTQGLKDLLFRSVPKIYTEEDLNNYRHILFLTSAHKRGYSPYGRINANKNDKYRTIISKLFPPKRCSRNVCSKGDMLVKNDGLSTSVHNTTIKQSETEEKDVNPRRSLVFPPRFHRFL